MDPGATSEAQADTVRAARLRNATALNINPRRSATDSESASVYSASHHRCQGGECEKLILSTQPTVNGSDVLARVTAFIKRFIALSESQVVVVTLWVAHTHALDAAETTPYLNISSAEKQCGKTLLLEVLELRVAKPWLTGSASKAVLVRKIDAEQPTLLLDESDAAFAGDRDYAEALRGVLNCGHSRGGVASLCVGQGANITFRDFQVFCPKAIAGIGKLPGTVADRSIPIRMKRRAPNETVERFRRRLQKADSTNIREQLTTWLLPGLQTLRDAEPPLPAPLSDRQQDGCEPLLAIADLACSDWPLRARTALMEILQGEAAEDSSTGIRLLSDIRMIFRQQNYPERIFTADLIADLCDLDPLWLEFSHSKPLSAASLARLLKAFEIKPRKLRIGDRTASGYLREWFSDGWARYLPHEPEQVEQSNNDTGESASPLVEQNVGVPARLGEESAVNKRVVPRVLFSGDNGEPLGHSCDDRPKLVARPMVRTPTARELGFKTESEPWPSLRQNGDGILCLTH